MSAKHTVILPAIGLLVLTLALSGCRAAPNQSVLDQQGQTQTEGTQAGHPDNTPGEADDQPIAGASRLSRQYSRSKRQRIGQGPSLETSSGAILCLK